MLPDRGESRSRTRDPPPKKFSFTWRIMGPIVTLKGSLKGFLKGFYKGSIGVEGLGFTGRVMGLSK